MKKMSHRITFATLCSAVVIAGAAAPAAANMILGGYAGPPVADQAPAAGQKSEARKAKAAAPTSRHARHVKAAVAMSDARSANASAPASPDARTTKTSAASAGQQDMDPRAAYLLNRKGNTSHQTTCDVDPQCNGWAQWLSDVESGRRPMVGAHAQ